MLELVSVMEPLYPKGIGWKLWKEKTPKHTEKFEIISANLLHVLSTVQGCLEAVLSKLCTVLTLKLFFTFTSVIYMLIMYCISILFFVFEFYGMGI